MPWLETLLLFFFSKYDFSERKMTNDEFPQSSDDKFAEKCKDALRKSWGMDIPTPKSLVKKVKI